MRKLPLLCLLLLINVNYALALSPTTNITDRSITALSENTTQVFKPGDFPAPSAGVITLVAGQAYQINGSIDISPNRIVSTGSNTIFGADPLNDFLISDNVGSCISGIDSTVFFYTFSYQCVNGTAFDFRNSGGNEKTSQFFATQVGTTADKFARFENLNFVDIFDSDATVTTNGIEVVGSQNGSLSIRFLRYPSLGTSGTALDLGSSVIDGIDYTNTTTDYVVGNTFIDGLGAGGNISIGSIGRITNNSSTGSTPSLNGVTINSPRWTFFDNNGIANGPVTAESFNGVVLTTAGSANDVLNAAGSYLSQVSSSLNTEVQYNNNGVMDGITGITTDGTNLQVSTRIDGNGVDGLLILRAASNSPIGGRVQIEGGGSNTTGGAVTSTGGLGNANGGNVENTGGEGANNKGGSIVDRGGNGGVDDGTGDGGDYTFIGGQGGFDSGDGGGFNATTGNAEGPVATSGSITLDIGDSISGLFGNVLLAKTRGSVGIGVPTVTSSAKLEINGLTQTDGILSLDDVKIQAPTSGTVQFSITDDTTADQLSLVYNDATAESDLIALSDLTVSSVNGDVVLQKDGGNVGIGTGASAAATTLDIQAGGPTVTIRNTADFGRSDLDLYGSRNAGAGNAELGSVSIFNTRSGSDVMVARMAFVNGASGTSAGGITFLTKENADGSLSVRLSIDDAGRVLINGEDASRIAPTTVEVFTTADLDPIAVGDVITVDGITLVLELKASITSTKRFNVINGGQLGFTANGDSTWTYSDTATFITSVAGQLNMSNVSFVGNSSATLFDITGNGLVSVNNCTILFWGSYGTIRETNLVLMATDGFFAGDSATLTLIDNATTSIANWGLASASAVTGAIILVSGEDTGFFDWARSNVTLQSGESFIRFDPFSPTLAANISNIRAIGGDSLFDTSGGVIEDFTAVADAAVALTTIDSVTDSSGIARFNFTVGPTMFVNQEADIINCTTETSYNQTGIITATGAGFFEIQSIGFAANDATCDFSGDSITLTIAATTLTDGSTFVIDTDLATDYDGGATAYNKLTNSVQVNRTFTTTQAGTVNTAGIDQVDPRVLSSQNPGFSDSKVAASSESHINTTFSTTLSNAYGAITVDSFIEGDCEGLKIIDETNLIYEVISNEPIVLDLDLTMWLSKSGATVQDYRVALSIDGVQPVFATAFYERMSATSNALQTHALLISPTLVKGQTIQPMYAGEGITDGLKFEDINIVIKGQ